MEDLTDVKFITPDVGVVRSVSAKTSVGEHSFSAEVGNPFWDAVLQQGITPAEYVDPRTPQQIYDEEVLAQLDAQVLKDAARMVEDFYNALESQLPQSMKDKHGPLMAERKAKRAARPA